MTTNGAVVGESGKTTDIGITVHRLRREILSTAKDQHQSRLPLLNPKEVRQVLVDYYVWDMWHVARTDGSTLVVNGQDFWFALAAPFCDDPEERHDLARIRFLGRRPEGWTDYGWALPETFSPGSREWSGCAVLENDAKTLTLYFTATGRRGHAHSFEQRLFEAQCEFDFARSPPALGAWSNLKESVKADGRLYKVADQVEAPPRGIWGFRDPSYFQDPADGREYLFFVGSSGSTTDLLDGIIGVAVREGEKWELRPPIVDAIGVSSELERPQVVHRNGSYFLFWSVHGRRFDPSINAPTGLYGAVARRLAGPWRPLNGSGLVAANPLEAPLQAYSWWVTGEGEVMSFVDYPGTIGLNPPSSSQERRARFGGTTASTFKLRFNGEEVFPEK